MHDLLFQRRSVLKHDRPIAYAEALALDLARFSEEFVSGAHAPRVREDFLSGVRSGVDGTPALFINEVRYDGPRDAAPLLAAIAEAARLTRHALRPQLRQER